jgi:malate permease and related proteins
LKSSQLLFSILADDILPIFIIAAIGFMLARAWGVEARGLARVTFNALSPCLVFNLLVTSTLGAADFGRMALFAVLVMAAAGVLGRIVAAPLHLDRPAMSAFLLVVMFSNGGNYGLPVALFAFGRDALTFASVYFVTSSVLTYTVGVFLAASGRRSIREALVGITRVPTVYAVAAAAIVLASGVTVPGWLLRPIAMLSDAALPVMILILGMQLQRAARPERPIVVAAAVALSLVITPAAAFLVARAIGLTGAAFQAAMIQASMPAAVVTTILALEYEIAPGFVTSVVFASTILSPLTLTLLIAWLR